MKIQKNQDIPILHIRGIIKSFFNAFHNVCKIIEVYEKQKQSSKKIQD